MSRSLELECINTLRFLAVDMVQNANSGHPGLPLGAAAMAYTLWSQQLKHHPGNPDWADRDRFVLSAGHGSALLYSLLYVTGYALSLDDLKRFRQWDSKTPGHPERGHTPGVEITTAQAGQQSRQGGLRRPILCQPSSSHARRCKPAARADLAAAWWYR